jgi:hypothetical protein
VVTGAGHVVDEASADPARYLRQRKSVKFMGVQDRLAVVAAGRALEDAGLLRTPLGPRTGLYLAVGYLPFDQEDIDRLIETSTDGAGAISMPLYSTRGYTSVNPLITFRCLSNMPAYHISANFDLQGPYLVTYPGAGQLYLALEAAVEALRTGRVDRALVAGVAHQRNFLVEHHFSRTTPPVSRDRLADAAACVVLERGAATASRPRLCLQDLDVGYVPSHPFEGSRVARESPRLGDGLEYGPASLPLLISHSRGEALAHSLESADGIVARSTWVPA